METAQLQLEDRNFCRVCKALSNPVRLQILRYVLAHPGCIGNQILLHLPEDAPHAQSTLSQHLRVLRTAGLLEAEEDGPAVCYFVNQDCLVWLCHEITDLQQVPIASAR